jgi:hypothetical protein
VFDRRLNEFFERVQINIFDFLDIQAGFARFVFAQFVEKVVVLIKASRNIEREVLFTRGESGYEPIVFPAALVFVMIGPKSNDATASHDRFFAGHFLHEV